MSAHKQCLIPSGILSLTVLRRFRYLSLYYFFPCYLWVFCEFLYYSLHRRCLYVLLLCCMVVVCDSFVHSYSPMKIVGQVYIINYSKQTLAYGSQHIIQLPSRGCTWNFKLIYMFFFIIIILDTVMYFYFIYYYHYWFHWIDNAV